MQILNVFLTLLLVLFNDFEELAYLLSWFLITFRMLAVYLDNLTLIFSSHYLGLFFLLDLNHVYVEGTLIMRVFEKAVYQRWILFCNRVSIRMISISWNLLRNLYLFILIFFDFRNKLSILRFYESKLVFSIIFLKIIRWNTLRFLWLSFFNDIHFVIGHLFTF
jgi:hypothetical protein